MRQYNQLNDGASGQPIFRAAEYVRMSTEHQQYSTDNQHHKIQEYADSRHIEIVKTYADDGKSGLRIEGRKALQQLLEDVQAGKTDFQMILVYDISRWGRFQDADESAYYEYICKRSGISVIYCAEQFENDGSPVSTIVKGVKRAMAGEYSRELSTKVFAGQCRLIELGFRQGGLPGYGLKRILLDQSGHEKGELKRGEYKSLQTDRVVLAPGTPNEIQIIGQIYHWFIEDAKNESEIASRLNSMKIFNELGHRWSRANVREILSNEKYIGNNIYNRVSFKLKKLKITNSPEMWIRKENAFEAIVSPEIFYTAQGVLKARARRYTDDELIERLRELYKSKGRLSGFIIDEVDSMPSSAVYANRFGSLIRAYELVGFTPKRDYDFIETNRFIRRLHPEIVTSTEAKIAKLGGHISRDVDSDLLTVNREFSVSLVVARCQTQISGKSRWKIRFDTSLVPDITVAVRLDYTNKKALDYFLLPRLDFDGGLLNLADQNPVEFECYRFDTLNYLYGMAEQTRLRRWA